MNSTPPFVVLSGQTVPSQSVQARNLINNPDYNCFQQRIVEKPCCTDLALLYSEAVCLVLQEPYLLLQSGASPPGLLAKA